MDSILQARKECWMCRKVWNREEKYTLECHHVFFGSANRKLSEKYGLKVWLCHRHHTGSDLAVHASKKADLLLKRFAQKEFESIHGRQEFMNIFGKNWLED